MSDADYKFFTREGEDNRSYGLSDTYLEAANKYLNIQCKRGYTYIDEGPKFVCVDISKSKTKYDTHIAHVFLQEIKPEVEKCDHEMYRTKVCPGQMIEFGSKLETIFNDYCPKCGERLKADDK